ncbi:MAG: hypothetical protein F6J96_34800 [Symploca sp. SIO1C2]|nr:hypothetical protein [Symploca sp. SIO1C2]
MNKLSYKRILAISFLAFLGLGLAQGVLKPESAYSCDMGCHGDPDPPPPPPDHDPIFDKL